MPGRSPDFATFHFPREPFEALLASLGHRDPDRWLQTWLERGGDGLAEEAWPSNSKPAAEWIWGLALPLLTQLESLAAESQRTVVGLSAVPATGKTTLCRWLRAAAARIGLSLDTISLDNFYFASPELDASMQGNPWGVCRGLPGSHDSEGLHRCIQDWRLGRPVSVPIFDKTLRAGRGDRVGSRPLGGRVLVVEGWFLGVPADHQTPSQQPDDLSAAEIAYQTTVLAALKPYEQVWQQIDHLWRIRPIDIRATALWKRQQTSFTLSKPDADQFIRMILCSIPARNWAAINSTVLVEIDAHRAIHWIGPCTSCCGHPHNPPTGDLSP